MLTAYCHIPADNIDEGPPAGTFELYRFFGDGEVSTDEWDQGSLTDHWPDVNGDFVFTVSVTSYLQHCVDNGLPYLSMVLRAGSGTDRYNLGDMAGLDEPWIELVP